MTNEINYLYNAYYSLGKEKDTIGKTPTDDKKRFTTPSYADIKLKKKTN